jgi:DNA uptake protein ComE-like DNA-binding protein
MRLQWLALALLAVLLGCNQKQDPQELKEKTAQATAELKSDAKAVASGVREGWSRDKPLNLNTASKDDLMALPGMTVDRTVAVMAGRPYDDPHQLVTRRILPQSEYDKIADRVTASGGKPSPGM